MQPKADKKGRKRKSKSNLSTDNTPINGFNELVAAFYNLEEFSQYQKEVPDRGICSLMRDDATLVCLGPEVWGDGEAFKPFLESLSKPELSIVLVGNEANIKDISKAYPRNHLLILCLPLDRVQLVSYISNLFEFRTRIIRSLQARQNVSDTTESIKYVLKVSRELSGIRDTNKLLSLILKKAREVCSADAGSIYVVSWDEAYSSKGIIHFKVSQNESVVQNLAEFQIPINKASIVGCAVINGTCINIPDLYKLSAKQSIEIYGVQHDRSWDRRIGYQCRSMLTLPIFDISNRVIGVIQLINKKKKNSDRLKNPSDFDERVLPFDTVTLDYAKVIAHQAGIALENALLNEEREKLFEGFVHAAITAVEQRDPTMSGHSERVATLTLQMAKRLNDIDTGPFKDVCFSEDQLKEIEFAALLHDFGKIGVDENILVKANKLYPWEEKKINQRFEKVFATYKLNYLRDYLNYIDHPTSYPPGLYTQLLSDNSKQKIEELEEFLDLIKKTNRPTVLDQEIAERLKKMATICYKDIKGNTQPLITNHELAALLVSKGSLTREELGEIQSHVGHTYEFLRKIPWGSKFANVPEIAANHHEKLDGTGYPAGVKATDIPLQARILAIADIFDALTASDRPYKKALSAAEAIKVLGIEAGLGKIDNDLFRVFVDSKVYAKIIKKPVEST